MVRVKRLAHERRMLHLVALRKRFYTRFSTNNERRICLSSQIWIQQQRVSKVICVRGLAHHTIAGVTSIQTGDWIRVPSLWPGIWKVYRVLGGFREDRWSLDEELRPPGRCLLFCYRLVNDSWRRSFFHQCCDASLARALSSDDRNRVEDLLSSDTKVVRAFEKYQAAAKPIDLVANLGFGEFKDSELEVFPPTCGRLLADRIADGLTMDEVLGILRDSWLGAHRRKFPNQATLQLVSPGRELRGDRFVYSSYRTLGF
jgi:hypothetical protein